MFSGLQCVPGGLHHYAGSQSWEDIGCHTCTYTPQPQDLGCQLLARCVPVAVAEAAPGQQQQQQQESRVGEAVEAVSGVCLGMCVRACVWVGGVECKGAGMLTHVCMCQRMASL
jgi:hypothetical protein